MKYNALVVDDSRTARAIIIKTLRLGDFPWGEIHEAGDGREALAVLDRTTIDLIFSDLHMPNMDGFELVAHLAADEHLSTIPIIVTSTEGNRERIAALSVQGVCAYLRKPFAPEDASRAVRQILLPDAPPRENS